MSNGTENVVRMLLSGSRENMQADKAFSENAGPRRRKRLVAILLLGLLAVAVPGGWIVYRILYTLRGLPDAYAMWDTGVLLIDYMQHHDNRWPGGWDDLGDSYQRLHLIGLGEHLRGGMTLNQLRDRVTIDSHVDTARIAAMPADPDRFHAISPRDSNTTLWEGADPNEMVWDYLHGRYPAAPASSQPSTK